MTDQLQRRIKGPVFPILPAFDKTGEFDAESTARYVRYLVENGAQTLMVTAGTSRLNLLTVDEIKSLNALAAKNSGEAIAIAANPDYGSQVATIEIAKAAAADGADAFLLYYSERYYDHHTVFDFYSSVSAACSLPLLIHAMPMRCASTGPTIVQNYDIGLVRKLFEIPTIIGMKEESGNEGLRQQLLIEFADDWAIIVAGGGMGKFLTASSLAASAYLTGLGNINPTLELEFYQACMENDLQKARGIVRALEQPFFQVAVPIGWHTALKGALSIAKLMPVYERRPMQPPSSEQMKELSAIMTTLKISAR